MPARAGLAPLRGRHATRPDQLVRVQDDPDRCHQCQSDDRVHRERRRNERGADDSCDQPAAADRARDSKAESDVGEQIERRPTAEGERRNDRQLSVDVCERRLHSERKEHDAHDHWQVQVRVRIAGQCDLLDAASVVEQLLRADREEVEVRQPEGRGHGEPEHSGDDLFGAEPATPSPQADRGE